MPVAPSCASSSGKNHVESPGVSARLWRPRPWPRRRNRGPALSRASSSRSLDTAFLTSPLSDPYRNRPYRCRGWRLSVASTICARWAAFAGRDRPNTHPARSVRRYCPAVRSHAARASDETDTRKRQPSCRSTRWNPASFRTSSARMARMATRESRDGWATGMTAMSMEFLP